MYESKTAPSKLVLDNSIKLDSIQYKTIQYNTIQYNTIQYSTMQYNIRNPGIKVFSTWMVLYCIIDYYNMIYKYVLTDDSFGLHFGDLRMDDRQSDSPERNGKTKEIRKK